MPLDNKTFHSKIQIAMDYLKCVRAQGDPLKIDLAENALNDLLERYRCHTCHGSQRKDK